MELLLFILVVFLAVAFGGFILAMISIDVPMIKNNGPISSRPELYRENGELVSDR